MRRTIRLLLLATPSLLVLGGAPAVTAAPGSAWITVIQAVPGADVDVMVDDRQVADGAEVGKVLGPFRLAPGSHVVSFRGDDMAVDSEMDVAAGSANDVVLHLPADLDGAPVVHSYAAPDGAIGPGKARVLLAHTATVAPADVNVDGRTVFTNIANGEFADADVPAGTIEVALLPSGSKGDPFLGPLDVSLDAGSLSMIYAYGNPSDGSMNVIAHTTQLAPDGSVEPSRIDTGSAGLVTAPVAPVLGPSLSPFADVAGALAALGVTSPAVAVLGACRCAGVAPSRPSR